MSLILSYPWWFLSFCILAGVVYAAALYYKGRKNAVLPLWLRRILAFLRFLTVSILCFLLLSPLVKYLYREVEKPIVVIAVDNSASIVINNDSTYYRQQFPQDIAALKKSLENNYEVHFYRFGDAVTDQDELNYADQQTDITRALEEVKVRFTNRNLGAVILASDGLYNKGINPAFVSEHLATPVYTVAMGDTSVRRDLIVSKVFHNQVVFLGNTFPLEIMVNARKLDGGKAVLTVSGDNGKLFEKAIDIRGEDYITNVNVVLSAEKPGISRYRIALSRMDGEITYLNNVRDIYVDVIDSRQKILVLTEAPHPDIGTIAQVVAANKNYQCDIFQVNDFKGSLKEYSLVIMYQLPGLMSNVTSLVAQINEQKIPVMYILGNSSQLNQFNTLGTGLKISGNRNNQDEVLPVPGQGFSLFQLSDGARSFAGKFPPLSSPFGNYEVSAGADVLLNRKIGSVSTESPLMMFYVQGGHKICVIAGEGIYRWRMYDFKSHQSHAIFDEIFSKTIQFLAVKEDKSFFRVNCTNEFLENENVTMEAELYNDSYELVNTPEVKVDVTNAEGKKYPFIFSRRGSAYFLDAGILPPGKYQYDAYVTYNGKPYKKTGAFTIRELQVEALNTVADHRLLYQLAGNTGGKMVYPREMNTIPDLLKSDDRIKPLSTSRKDLKDLLHFRWIFFVLLALLSLEWFFRKREGIY